MSTFNFGDILTNIFNFTKGAFENEPKITGTDDYPIRALDPKLKDVLGHLRRDLDVKSQRLRLALGAPFIVPLTGGGETLQFVGQYGGGAPTSDYVAPDRISEAVYSTARILARVLKAHEASIMKSISPELARELEARLKDLHKKEKELFSAVYTLGEVANLSSKNIGEVKTKVIDYSFLETNYDKREQILDEIRKLHDAAEKDRKAIFVGLGMP